MGYKINIVLGHALPFPPSRGGGIEKIDYALAKALVKLGNMVVVYSRWEEDLKFHETDIYGIRHVRIKGFDWSSSKIKNAFYSLRWCLSLFSRVESADATIFNSLFAFLIAIRKDIGITANSIQRTPDWKLFFYKLFIRNYCPCDSVRQQALRLPFKLCNLKTLYNCVEVAANRTYFKPDYSKGLKFLYFGRVTEDKGVEILIKGFEMLVRDFAQNKLSIIGPQSSKEGADEKFFLRMVSYVTSKKLSNSIEFLPAIYSKEELNETILNNDIICFPSLSGEGFPSAVLEAMELSKPLIVSDFGPMTEAVEHLRSGYITRTGDANSLAEAIRYFSENPEKIKPFGEYARKCVIEKFSSDIVAGELIRDIGQILIGNRLK